jgi:para-nitrobenzyl esterase
VAEEISSYWVNFARSGNPNSPDLPSWPAFTNTDTKVLAISDPITVDGVTNINGLKVFDDVYTSVRGKPFATRYGCSQGRLEQSSPAQHLTILGDNG